jgi:hypothetical protein
VWKSNVTNRTAFASPHNDDVGSYYIGVLMADGFVNTRRKCPVVELSMALCDRELVDGLNSYLGGNQKVSVRVQTKKTSAGQQDQARICFGSRDVVENLMRCGVLPRKTFTAEADNCVANDRHFWRGMIDGDGCINFSLKNGRPYPRIVFGGGRRIVEQFIDFVKTVCPEHRAIAVRNKHVVGGELVSVAVAGRNAKRLAEVLYADAPVSLSRKLALARQAMEWNPKPRGVAVAA